ncbi:hypothetical protein C0Q70_14531 [Pomacea canaliculata]|uniref:Apple domain-containing protein n=1 Tax=Pomacea canaliculata TaxID=400727 RepID=A0A2T7NSA8_POMCA|nr:hypothetical protein C0Q70_14531 [Pomacea canaliculata]
MEYRVIRSSEVVPSAMETTSFPCVQFASMDTTAPRAPTPVVTVKMDYRVIRPPEIVSSAVETTRVLFVQFATMDSMTTTAPARAVSVKMAKCVIRLLGAVVSAVTTTSFPCVKTASRVSGGQLAVSGVVSVGGTESATVRLDSVFRLRVWMAGRETRALRSVQGVPTAQSVPSPAVTVVVTATVVMTTVFVKLVAVMASKVFCVTVSTCDSDSDSELTVTVSTCCDSDSELCCDSDSELTVTVSTCDSDSDSDSELTVTVSTYCDSDSELCCDSDSELTVTVSTCDSDKERVDLRGAVAGSVMGAAVLISASVVGILVFLHFRSRGLKYTTKGVRHNDADDNLENAGYSDSPLAARSTPGEVPFYDPLDPSKRDLHLYEGQAQSGHNVALPLGSRDVTSGDATYQNVDLPQETSKYPKEDDVSVHVLHTRFVYLTGAIVIREERRAMMGASGRKTSPSMIIFSLLPLLVGSVLLLPSQELGEYFVRLPTSVYEKLSENSIINGPVRRSLQSASLLSCGMECESDLDCVAFNVLDTSSRPLTCELIGLQDFTDPTQSTRTGWTAFQRLTS